MTDTNHNQVLFSKTFVNKREFLSFRQCDIVKSYQYLWSRHFIFNLIRNGFLSQLSDIIKYVFWDLLNINFVEFIFLSCFISQPKVNCTKFINIDGNACWWFICSEYHSSWVIWVLRHWKVKIFSLPFVNFKYFFATSLLP